MFLRSELKNIFKSAVLLAPATIAGYFSIQANPLLGTAVVSTALLYAKFKNRHITNHLEPFPEFQERTDIFAKEMGINRKIHAVKSDRRELLAAAYNNHVELSENTFDYNDEASQNFAIRHELWHIRRRDFLPTSSRNYASNFTKAALAVSSISIIGGLGLDVQKAWEVAPEVLSMSANFLIAGGVSFLFLNDRLTIRSQSENHEMEFECDRAAADYAQDVEGGISYFQSAFDYVCKTADLSTGGWEIYDGYKEDGYYHPSTKSRIQSLKEFGVTLPSHDNA